MVKVGAGQVQPQLSTQAEDSFLENQEPGHTFSEYFATPLSAHRNQGCQCNCDDAGDGRWVAAFPAAARKK